MLNILSSVAAEFLWVVSSLQNRELPLTLLTTGAGFTTRHTNHPRSVRARWLEVCVCVCVEGVSHLLKVRTH